MREADDARLGSGLALSDLGSAIGLSGSQVGRLLRGDLDDVGIVRLSELLAAVGLDLGARAYPAGPPIRDRAHLALLERLHTRIHPALKWQGEAPVVELPGAVSDARAWDVRVDGAGWSIGVEAETRLRDLQALQRRIALKARDGLVDSIVLLVADTRGNRAAVRFGLPALADQFPEPPRRTLRRLRAGERPNGNTLVLL